MKHKITDRQLVALLAAYFDQRLWDEPSGVYSATHPDPAKAGKPIWRSRTHMGGAVQRMTDTLTKRGYITLGDHYSLREKPWYDAHGQLTSVGYEAIEERRKARTLPVVNREFNAKMREADSKLPEFDFNDAISLDGLRARKAARGAREEEIKRLIKQERDENQSRMRANAERVAGERLAKLRKLFSGRGLADNWSDDELLAFAEQVASA